MDKESILKNIKGWSTGKEKEDLFEWVNGSRENADFYYSLEADHLFDNLPYSVMEPGIHSGVMSRISGRIRLRSYLIRAAAVLFIPLALFAVYKLCFDTNTHITDNIAATSIPQQSQITTLYKVNAGVKGLVNLPDGSRVWLNSNSTLECPDKFDSLNRIVELNGEGYFYVESNREWPMYVKTKRGITVKVTGTEFNLSSYENDDELKFTLVSGAATLIRESTKQEISVNVLEEIVIPDNINSGGKKALADIKLNTGWKDGFLVFDDTSMNEVIKKMERWYGVRFDVKNPEIFSYFFTATFSSESVTQVLELLKITSNIDYSIKNNFVTLFLK